MKATLKQAVRNERNLTALPSGYGHHFAHYDHNEHEVGNYYAFRVD